MYNTYQKYGALKIEELLEVCNQVRKAGGGELLSKLLPGTANDSNACLIATNLNFNSNVDLYYMFYDKVAEEWVDSPEHLERLWCMSASNQYLELIHKELGWRIGYGHRLNVGQCRTEAKSDPESGNPALLLPEKLACSAEAFDEHAYDSSLYWNG